MCAYIAATVHAPWHVGPDLQAFDAESADVPPALIMQ